MTRCTGCMEWNMQITDRSMNKVSDNMEREALERDSGRYR